MTSTTIARVFGRCTTVARCLRAAERCRRTGRVDLAEALWCRACELRLTGYPDGRELYRRRRSEALARLGQ